MGRKVRSRLLAVLFAGVLALSGCASSGGGEPAPPLVGAWESTDAGGPHLVFGEDGEYAGSDGCNALWGEYERTGDEVTLSPGASTLKACPGIDTWLFGARTLRIEGDVLHVFDGSGDQIGTLGRTG